MVEHELNIYKIFLVLSFLHEYILPVVVYIAAVHIGYNTAFIWIFFVRLVDETVMRSHSVYHNHDIAQTPYIFWWIVNVCSINKHIMFTTTNTHYIYVYCNICSTSTISMTLRIVIHGESVVFFSLEFLNLCVVYFENSDDKWKASGNREFPKSRTKCITNSKNE